VNNAGILNFERIEDTRKRLASPFRLKYLTVLKSVNVTLRPPTVWSSANVRNFQSGDFRSHIEII
jgi:hypothetical protein